jgi:hypothetical protein
MTQIVGYHCTSKEVWNKIKTTGSLKGSKWLPDMTTANSDPSRLHRDGAVWCYPSLAIARDNADEGEVILKVVGEGQIVEHYAHGTCHVGVANRCKATLVRKNQKA